MTSSTNEQNATKSDGKHECPRVGCPARLPQSTLACRAHWATVPRELQRALTATWRNGDMSAYFQLRTEAVDAMNGGPR